MRKLLTSSLIATSALLTGTLPAARADRVYGLKSMGTNTAVSVVPTRFFTFEDDATAFTDVGTVTVGGAAIAADGLALSLSGSLLGYRLDVSGPVPVSTSTLVSIDPTTAAAVPIGAPLVGRDIRGATFDSAGALRVLDAAGDELLQVDPSTGAILGAGLPLTLGGSPFDLSTATDLAQRRNGTFYLVDLGTIFTLDAGTGVLTPQFTDPGEGLSGAAFSAGAPADALFGYDINGTEEIYRYSLDAAFARTTEFTNIIPAFNAGRGDLAAPPTVPEPVGAVALALGSYLVLTRVRHVRARTPYAG